MRNNTIRLFLCAAALLGTACANLDIEPTKNLREDQVYSDPVGVTAALATLYSYLPIGAYNASIGSLRGDSTAPFSIWNNPSMVTGETECIPLRVALTKKSLTGDMMAWWDYTAIRFGNLLIKNLLLNADKFRDNPALYNHWLGEAYFCRAYMYYHMTRSYGGVPIVTDAPSYVDLSEEELQVPRSTEKACYDFIAEDLDRAYELMGDSEVAPGRANKYIAAGLKSRAMLYAACEARFGTVQLDGLVGIPAQFAKDYYKAAYEAAGKAMDNGGRYELYKVYDDGTYEGKKKNYWKLFIDETSANRERMFIKEYDAGASRPRPENWTCQQLPYHYSMVTDSGELSPTVEWIQLFETVDGEPFVLNLGADENPVRYDKLTDLFAKAEPRLRGAILVPGDVIPNRFNGEDEVTHEPTPAIFEVRKGIYESYPGTLHEAADFNTEYNGMKCQGWCGIGNNMTNGNGCLVWKYVDPEGTPQFWAGSVDWIEMRYAEILLNRAEAAINLIGEEVDGVAVTLDDALEPVNAVRERAGAVQLTTLDEDRIFKERRCELAFENRTFWDIKRWRKCEEIIQNKTFNALYPYYVFDEGKYIFKLHERTEIRYTFDAKAYYAGISSSVIAKSDGAIVQNPGY